MDASPDKELALQLKLDGDTITGAICDDTGRRLPFAGWLGLTVVIERLVGEMRGDAGTPRIGSGDGS